MGKGEKLFFLVVLLLAGILSWATAKPDWISRVCVWLAYSVAITVLYWGVVSNVIAKIKKKIFGQEVIGWK